MVINLLDFVLVLLKKKINLLKVFLKKNNLGSFNHSKEFVVSDLEQYKVGNKYFS